SRKGTASRGNVKQRCNTKASRRTVFPVSRDACVLRCCWTSLLDVFLHLGSWRRPTLPRPRSRSTIGADRLNDRVRDGNGCGPVALVASKIGGSGLGARDEGISPSPEPRVPNP